MENHPIPQDVTGFQFRLIGDMTVKQFAYLLGSVGVGWFFYILPILPIIKFPLAIFSVLIGVALAFLPIEGRPLDVMITNFIKALFTPEHYIFDKMGKPIFPTIQQAHKAKPHHDAKKTEAKQGAHAPSPDKLQMFLSHLPKTSTSALDQREIQFLQKFQTSDQAPHAGYFTVEGQEAQPKPVEQKENRQKEKLEHEAEVIEQELAQAKQEEATHPDTSGEAHKKVLELEKQLSEVMLAKEQLEQELFALQKQLASQKQTGTVTPTVATPKPSQNVHMVPKNMSKSIGILTPPEAPNLLTGIVKDSRGNVLPNILVEVVDGEGNPRRAFKTNGLGQFAAATQLPNGIYTIVFEDATSKHKFETVQLSLTGQVVLPLEVISVDEREELRKELFST